MSDQFQHVMVLISIIIGLGITNLLLGVSGAIERLTENTRPLRMSWATVFWLAYLFLLMVLFWWWEFRLSEILKQWTLWNYFLVICYAVVLFLQVALLIPRDWDKVDDMNEYFLAKRRWFYSVFALSLIIDLIDSYMKGGLAYIKGTGVLTWGFNFIGLLAAFVGFRSTRIRTHSVIAILFLLWEIIIGFDVSPSLHVGANQSMEPTPPLRSRFSVFAKATSISSRCPASLVQIASSRSRTAGVKSFNASPGLSLSR